ncbi:hypothetical protein A4A49_54369, partial [Nicotiana attenuata]
LLAEESHYNIANDVETLVYKSRCKFEDFEQVDKLVIVLLELLDKILYYFLGLLAFSGQMSCVTSIVTYNC